MDWLLQGRSINLDRLGGLVFLRHKKTRLPSPQKANALEGLTKLASNNVEVAYAYNPQTECCKANCQY